jgi:hypothetical protein
MATARRTAAVTSHEGLGARPPRRRGAPTAAEPFIDRSQWTVSTADSVTGVGSRAAAWSAATGLYVRGHPVNVRSTA